MVKWRDGEFDVLIAQKAFCHCEGTARGNPSSLSDQSANEKSPSVWFDGGAFAFIDS
jgi:hypothetical protein